MAPQFDDSIDGMEQSISYRLTKEYLSSYRLSDSTYEEAEYAFIENVGYIVNAIMDLLM